MISSRKIRRPRYKLKVTMPSGQIIHLCNGSSEMERQAFDEVGIFW